MTEMGNKALDVFLEAVKEQVTYTIESVDKEALGKAAELIQESVKNGGRIHVTGIGKPGHLAGYISSLMASTGTPTYFLHGTEAVHGSSGQLVEGDVVWVVGENEDVYRLIGQNCDRKR